MSELITKTILSIVVVVVTAILVSAVWAFEEPHVVPEENWFGWRY